MDGWMDVMVVGKEKGKDFEEVVQTNKKRKRMKKNTGQNQKMRCVFFSIGPVLLLTQRKQSHAFFALMERPFRVFVFKSCVGSLLL